MGQNGDIAAMGPVALKPFLLIALDRAGNQEPAPNHPLQYLAYSSGERGLDKRYPLNRETKGPIFSRQRRLRAQ